MSILFFRVSDSIRYIVCTIVCVNVLEREREGERERERQTDRQPDRQTENCIFKISSVTFNFFKHETL